MTPNPCYGCKDRCVGCKSTCVKNFAWEMQHQKEKKELAKQRKKYASLAGPHLTTNEKQRRNRESAEIMKSLKSKSVSPVGFVS